MARFIEVHREGNPILVNLDWVEEVMEAERGATIYFAFNLPHAEEQDYVTVDESFDEMLRKIVEVKADE